MKPEIHAFFNERVFQSGLTYTAHPISLAAAIANIQVIQEDHLVEKARDMGRVLHQKLADLGENHPSVVNTHTACLDNRASAIARLAS
jgi:taurine--2-oxoglutarate transaminase